MQFSLVTIFILRFEFRFLRTCRSRLLGNASIFEVLKCFNEDVGGHCSFKGKKNDLGVVKPASARQNVTAFGRILHFILILCLKVIAMFIIRFLFFSREVSSEITFKLFKCKGYWFEQSSYV